MRTDLTPALNLDLECIVARLKQHRALLADELDNLDRLIHINEMAMQRDARPDQSLVPGTTSTMPAFFKQWANDLSRKDAKPLTPHPGTEAPLDGRGVPMIWDERVGGWEDDLRSDAERDMARSG